MECILSEDELIEFADYIPIIPWLGYDHKPSQIGEFDDYALQRGWSRERLLDLKEGRLGNVDTNGLKPFLQSWFSIGLCEMVLGMSLDKDAFVTIKDSDAFFTSQPLNQILRNLWIRFSEGPKDDHGKIELMERFVRVLAAACEWNRMLGHSHLFILTNPDFCDDDYKSIMRLFVLIGASIQYSCAYFPGRFVEERFWTRLINTWDPIYPNHASLCERIVQRGWCRYIPTVLSPYSIVVREYASIVGPPSTRINHDKCSSKGCVRHNIDESTYKPLHMRPDCQCTSVRPDMGEIAKVLDSGGFPLVDFNKIQDVNGRMTVAVVPYENDKTSFTAISHVWSGGLGSTSEEGLPACVIEYLTRYLAEEDSSRLVWMDSLCIPGEKRLRELSIIKMMGLYGLADQTMVLDPEFIQTTYAGGRRALLWVTTAAWMQRLWTLSEGRLSKRPFFIFANCSMSLHVLMSDAEQHDSLNPVTGYLEAHLVRLFVFSHNALRYIQQSLCYRMTTKGEDEALALAMMFDIDVRPILDTTSLDNKMAMFWIALSKRSSIPMNILFIRSEKLAMPGLRWAPRSLLHLGRQFSLIEPPVGVTAYDIEVGDNGTLTATYVVIHLTLRSTLLLGRPNNVELFLVDLGLQQRHRGRFAIHFLEDVGAQDKDADMLEDIDAFAVNVTNLEAKSAQSLTSELLRTMHPVVALTLDSPDHQPSAATKVSPPLFIPRRWMYLTPVECKGDLIEAYVGWQRISIS